MLSAILGEGANSWKNWILASRGGQHVLGVREDVYTLTHMLSVMGVALHPRVRAG